MKQSSIIKVVQLKRYSYNKKQQLCSDVAYFSMFVPFVSYLKYQ